MNIVIGILKYFLIKNSYFLNDVYKISIFKLVYILAWIFV